MTIWVYKISSSTHVAVMTAAIIIMDVHSTIFELFSPFPYMLLHHDVTKHLCQYRYFSMEKNVSATKTESNWGIFRGTTAVS
jgi:hypothetical protein